MTDGRSRTALLAAGAVFLAALVLPALVSGYGIRILNLALISAIAVTWSGVSSKGNDASSSTCHGESGSKGNPGFASRMAYSLSSSSAMSWTVRPARERALAQSEVPKRCSDGSPSPPPRYF